MGIYNIRRKAMVVVAVLSTIMYTDEMLWRGNLQSIADKFQGPLSKINLPNSSGAITSVTSVLESMEALSPSHHDQQQIQIMNNDTSIIVVSNLIPTHPSIAMINATVHSIYHYLQGLSPTAPLILACDGILRQDQQPLLQQYIDNLKEEFHLPHQKIIVANYSVGLTANLKNGMDFGETEFVYVVQHDMPFIRPVQHATIIKTMKEYPDLLPLVRFNLYDNNPRTKKELEDPVFIAHYGADSSVKNVNGIHFTKTALWSDNNHLTRRSYYEELWPYFQHMGGFTSWKRPPEVMMMREILRRDFPNCTRWCTHLYGPLGDAPYIGHFDGRKSRSIEDYDAVIYGNNNSSTTTTN